MFGILQIRFATTRQSPIMVLGSSTRGPPSIVKYVASTGFNNYRPIPGCEYSRHAEMDAMLKLESNSKYRSCKSKKVVNLLVIRVNSQGEFRDSRPCFKCMEHLAGMKYHRIKYIYYSNQEGQIIRVKFSELYDRRLEYKTMRFR